jgi:MOSC domain-containing protein YiiM
VYGSGIQAAMFDAAVQAGDPASPRWGLSGFYASVVQPGTVRPGDAITLGRERAGGSIVNWPFNWILATRTP